MSPKVLSRAAHQKELTRQSCAIRKISRSQYSGLSAGARSLAVNAYADRTQAIDHTALSAYVRFGGDLLTDTSQKVANVLAAIAGSVRASTFETYFGGLRRMLTEIGREDVLENRVISNIVRGVRRQRQPARRARALLAHEVERMIAGLLAQGDLESRRDAHLLMGAFAGALRSAEALSLRAETLGPNGFADLSIAAACKGETDSEQSRVFLVSWSDELNVQERMLAWAIELDGRGGGWLFPKVVDDVIVEEPCSYSEYAHALGRAAELAKVDTTNLTTHSLRAGRITEEVESGSGLMEISRLSRHGDLNTLQRYHRPGVGPRSRMMSLSAPSGKVEPDHVKVQVPSGTASD